MSEVLHVLDVLPAAQRTIHAAEVRTRDAYVALVEGRPSKEDCQIILVDLALASGYYHTTHATMPAEQVKFCEGMRSVYGRIMRFANMPLDEVRAYQTAAIALQQRVGDDF
jgi:hypothetical protein